VYNLNRQQIADTAPREKQGQEHKMTKTYRIVFSDNAGSRAVDAIATTVQGSWSNAVERFDGEHDLAFVEVPADNAEYLESILDDDSNVISYSERA